MMDVYSSDRCLYNLQLSWFPWINFQNTHVAAELAKPMTGSETRTPWARDFLTIKNTPTRQNRINGTSRFFKEAQSTWFVEEEFARELDCTNSASNSSPFWIKTRARLSSSSCKPTLNVSYLWTTRSYPCHSGQSQKSRLSWSKKIFRKHLLPFLPRNSDNTGKRFVLVADRLLNDKKLSISRQNSSHARRAKFAGDCVKTVKTGKTWIVA